LEAVAVTSNLEYATTNIDASTKKKKKEEFLSIKSGCLN
jgi:hypothetical protein